MKLFGMLVLLASLSISALAQEAEKTDGPCASKYGKDTAETQKNLSMFNQYFQSKEYHRAYPYYRYLIDNAPCVNQRLLYNGNLIVESVMAHLGQNDVEAYQARFNGLLDTLYMSYQMRIDIWGNEGYVKGKWAYSISYYQEHRLADAMAMFAESVKMQGNKTDDNIPSYYILAAVKAANQKLITVDSLYNIYFQLMDIIMYNKENKSQGRWNETETYVNQVMAPYFSCDKLEEYYKPLINASPDDLDLKKAAVKLLVSAQCESSDFYLEIAEQVAVADPTADAYISLAKGNLAKGKRSKAKELYRKGADMMESGPAKVDALVSLMTLNYGDKEYAKARTLANQILSMDPNNGHAYLVLAGVYAGMTALCTDDGIEGKSMYWVAYDMAAKAANSTEEDVAADARKLMGYYKSNFVTITFAFQRNFTAAEGSPFSVSCVGMTTTVRYRSEQ